MLLSFKSFAIALSSLLLFVGACDSMPHLRSPSEGQFDGLSRRQFLVLGACAIVTTTPQPVSAEGTKKDRPPEQSAGGDKPCQFLFDQSTGTSEGAQRASLQFRPSGFVITPALPAVLNDAGALAPLKGAKRHHLLVTTTEVETSPKAQERIDGVFSEWEELFKKRNPLLSSPARRRVHFEFSQEQIQSVAWDVTELVEGTLTDEMSALLHQEARSTGPNCWATSLYLAGLPPSLMYKEGQDFQRLVEGPVAREQNREDLEFGDILAIRYYDEEKRLNEVHAATFVTPSIVFSKDLPDQFSPFNLSDVSGYHTRFKMKNSPEHCLMSNPVGFRGSRECPSFGTIFRPKSLTKWMEDASASTPSPLWVEVTERLETDKKLMPLDHVLKKTPLNREAVQELKTHLENKLPYLAQTIPNENLFSLPTTESVAADPVGYLQSLYVLRHFAYSVFVERKLDERILVPAIPGFSVFTPSSDPAWPFSKPSLTKEEYNRLKLTPMK